MTLESLVALGRLTKDQREAFIDHNLIGRPLEAIGNDMGLTRQRVHQVQRDARVRLRVMLRREDVAA